LTQIGRFKDEANYRWTADQQADVQHVVDNFTYDYDDFKGDMFVRFVRDLGSLGGRPIWGQRRAGRLLMVKKHIDNDATKNINRRRYTIAHESGHQLDADRLGSNEKQQLMALMKPDGRYDNWREGAYEWMASEVFAHEFAHLYMGGGGSWGNILTGSNEFYRRSFNDSAAAKALIDTFTDSDGDDHDDDDDGSLPVTVWLPAKDLSRRKKPDGTSKQGSGRDEHLPMGRIPYGPAGGVVNWIYDALLKFDADFPDDIETINTANLELTVIGAPGGTTHLIGSGDKSVLRAQRVLQDWAEGNNEEGEWDSSDWVNPSVSSNVAALGAVGSKVTGTRMAFDVMAHVRQWAPSRVAVAGLGEGKGNPNHGQLLTMARTDKIDGATEFGSGENGTTAYQPRLRIEYTPKSSNPVGEAIGPAGEINTNIFHFEGEYNLPIGEDVLGKVEIQVKRAGGSNVWTPAERLATANEESLGIFSTASSAQGAPAWVVGVGYEWRFRVRSKRSGKQSEWTDWLAFSITNTAPTVSATSLGSKQTLDGVYFGGPFTGPATPAIADSMSTPAGFARMSMWMAYWKGLGIPAFTSAVNLMVEMNMRGAILMGLDWNSPYYELPADVEDKLDILIANGITPYLGVWLKQLDSAELTLALGAWADGNGKWGGVVVDIEEAWKTYQSDHPVTAEANLVAFETGMRAVMSGKPLAYSSYGTVNFHTDMNYPLLDDHFDLFLGQIYSDTKAENTVAGMTTSMNQAFNQYNNMGLTLPYIPVMSAYGSGANAPTRRYFAERALEQKGGVSFWKYATTINSDVRAVFASLPRDLPGTPVPQQLRVVGQRTQLRPEAEGNPAWANDIGTLWDTGEVALNSSEHENLRVRRLYRGQRLEAGTYTYRVQVQDSLGAWSAWDYATVTLTDPYQPDSGAIDYLSQYRQQSKVRIRIFDMDANRGPGEVKAIIYDAQHIGASTVANDVGEFYFTVPTMHPQASEIEPLQRHYALEFYRGGIWKPLFEGVIMDMDADEDEVVFYGLDYMGLLSKNVETAFFTTDQPEKSIDSGGSKYIDKTISYVIKDQLQRGHDLEDSTIGFIEVEATADHVLMESIPSKVTINAAFRERLGFILGLIQSAKQGTGLRSRLWPERTADGTYQWRYKNNAGTERDNLRLRYGELVQGFRVVLLGDWAARVYGVGRITNEVKPRFKMANAPGIDTGIWGNVAQPAVWNDLIDENDLQRRVKQLALEMGKFGKSVALGLRVSGIEVFDGWNLLDNVPVEIQRGAVDTTRYGSGYWTIQGVEYRLEPDGHDELTLAIKPREDSTAPDPDLIPSHPVSNAGEWTETVGENLMLTSATVLRDDGTVAAVVTAQWDPLDVENFDLYAVQIARVDLELDEEPDDADFQHALMATTPNATIDFEDMLPDEQYAVRVGAYDTMGNFTGFSDPTVITAATDNTIPPVPAGLSVGGAIRSLVISWEPVGATDLAFYEVSYRLNGTSDPFVTIQTGATLISITGLQANDAGTIKYDVKVRAVDLSENRSAYGPTVVGTPNQVTGGVIALGSISTEHIDTEGIDAGVMTTGYMSIGEPAVPEPPLPPGSPPVFVVYNGAGVEIGRIDSTGMYWQDPTNTNRRMRFLDGVLEFSNDGGATWTTAINADGILANSLLIGHIPGGHNLIPNSSFELADFIGAGSKMWDVTGDWDDKLAGSVLIDDTTGDLKMTSVTY